MELKITEINEPQTLVHKNKKQVTYNDILSKMSMCVIDGKLQLYNKKLDDNVLIQEPKSILKSSNTKKVNFSQGQMNKQTYSLPQQQQQQQQDLLPPLTERQYKQLVFLNNLKRQQERERMSQIKSTKILYSNNNVNIKPTATITPHLFRFIGK